MFACCLFRPRGRPRAIEPNHRDWQDPLAAGPQGFMASAKHMARLAINRLGRIGRTTLELILDKPGWELAAINDVVPADNLAYLLRCDTAYGRYGKQVDARTSELIIDGRGFPVLNEKDPTRRLHAPVGSREKPGCGRAQRDPYRGSPAAMADEQPCGGA